MTHSNSGKRDRFEFAIHVFTEYYAIQREFEAFTFVIVNQQYQPRKSGNLH